MLCLPIALLLAARLVDMAPIPSLRNGWNDALAGLFRSSTPPENPVLIVAIDDKSLARIGRWPWSRGKLADLVEATSAADPTLIGINLLLADDQTDDATGDLRLARTISTIDTVLGSEIIGSTATGLQRNLLSSLPRLRQHAAAEGFLSAFPDDDGRLRGQPAALTVDAQLVPSFSTEIIRTFSGISTLEIEPGLFGTPARLALADKRLSLDWQGRLLPDFGALSVARQLSAVDLLDGNIDRADLAGRLVIIGVTATDLGGNWQVPTQGGLSGTAVQSLFVQAALTGAVLQRPAPLIAVELAVGLFLAGSTLAVSRRRPRRGLTRWIVGCAVLLVLGGLGAYGVWHLVADITWPGLCLALGMGLGALDRFVFLRREAHRLRGFNAQLIEQAGDMIVTLDAEQKITSANASAARIFGAQPDTLVGRPLSDFLSDLSPNIDHQGLGARMQSLEASTKVPPAKWLANIEISKSALTGMEPTVWLLVGRDTTRLRSAERRLDITSERLRAILDTVPIGVGLFGSDRRLMASNVAFRDLLGVATGQANPTYEQILDDWHPLSEEATDPTDDQSPSQDDSGIRSPAKSIIHLGNEQGCWICLHLSSPRVGGLLVAAYDETDTKVQALAQNEQMKRALAAEAAKGVLLANVSHELRTPLNAILGFSDIMRQDTDALKPRRYAQYVDHIHESASYLLSLVDDLLDGSPSAIPETQEPHSTCDLAKEVESVATSLRSFAANADVRLDCTVPGESLVARMAQRHARQIISNLLTNGIKFTPSGGSVAIDIGVTDRNDAVLNVRDTGVGMSRGDIDHATRRFAQARSGARGEKGYGLGLAIVNSILPIYDLKLDIDTEEGSGTSVTVTFPSSLLVSEVGDATSK